MFSDRMQNRCHDPRNFCFSSNVQHFGLLITTPPLESFVPDEPTHEILVHNETADCDLQFFKVSAPFSDDDKSSSWQRPDVGQPRPHHHRSPPTSAVESPPE